MEAPRSADMAEHFEITDAMRAAIGTTTPPWTYEVTTTSVRAFARGVGYTDPVYFDVEAARRAGYRNLPAPPTYLGTPVFIPGRSSDTFSTPVEGTPRLDHGPRASKALGTMLIVTVETTFTNAATGKVAAVQRGQAIY
jgi:hypothetical protein